MVPIVSFDNQWFSTLDDMQENQLLEVCGALLVDSITVDASGVLEVFRRLHQPVNVEVRWDGLKASVGDS